MTRDQAVLLSALALDALEIESIQAAYGTWGCRVVREALKELKREYGLKYHEEEEPQND